MKYFGSLVPWMLVLLELCAMPAMGDIYLHMPRGSNNRLNEKSANRNNANRVFDSQNNNKGGYNVGDSTNQASGGNEGKQYRMKYFQSSPAGKSYLSIEWTNQHGCGGNEDSNPQKQNCQLVLQYMCQKDVSSPTGTKDTLRNGVNTGTQQYQPPGNLNENIQTRNNRKNGNVQAARVIQDPWDWYDKCYVRERNNGLFVADQKLKKNKFGYSSAIYTRENPNGDRYGYECPEERDYYPYWHATPWIDIAVLANNASMCSYLEPKSFNTQPYSECVEFYSPGVRKYFSRWNNKAKCEENQGQWVTFHSYMEKATEYKSEAQCTSKSGNGVTYIWAVPYDAVDVNKKECLVRPKPVDCKQAPWSRSNHLGNGADGVALNYQWELPYFPSGQTQRCVFRMRYNISTDDYDPYNTDQQHNEDINNLKSSPIEQNPYVDIGLRYGLRLNINTNQTGRIFQDRSHVFLMEPRPDNMKTQRLFNLNVRGKRGNIVQTYPAVEYDFHPNRLKMNSDDLVHIQWTGSNTHNNGNPAGDGQAGDEGQGTAGTDRNNMVQISDLNENYPMPFEQSTMFAGAEIKWIYHGKTSVSASDLAVNLASSGYYICKKKAECANTNGQTVDSKGKLNDLLNNAPASYEGVVLKFKAGTYHYMCTRNNNFTNRSQKGTIIVK